MSWNADNTVWSNSATRGGDADSLTYLGNGEWRFTTRDLGWKDAFDEYAADASIDWGDSSAIVTGGAEAPLTFNHTYGTGINSVTFIVSYSGLNDGAGYGGHYNNGIDELTIEIPEVNPDNPYVAPSNAHTITVKGMDANHNVLATDTYTFSAGPVYNTNLQTGDVVGFSVWGYRIPDDDDYDNFEYISNVFSGVFDYIEWYPHYGNYILTSYDGWATPIPTFLSDNWRNRNVYINPDYQKTLGYLYDHAGVVSGYEDDDPPVFPGVQTTNRTPLGSFIFDIENNGYPPAMGATGTMLRYSASNIIHGWVGSSKWVINYSRGSTDGGGNAGWDGTVRMGRFILGEEITNASPESNTTLRNTAWSAQGVKASTVDGNVNLPGGCGTAGKPIFGNAGDIHLSQSGNLCAPDYYEGRHPVLTESPFIP